MKNSWWRRWAPLFLLVFAWILEGAKTEGQFAAWALMALAYCFFAWNKRAPDISTLITTLLGLSLIAFSQINSLDFHASLFWSFQIAVFVMLWPSLRSDAPEIVTDKYGLLLLDILFSISAFITIWQRQRNITPYGMLPINPNFNATWMTLGAVFLTAKLANRMSKNIWQRNGEILLILTLALLVVFGHSRSGLVALGFGLGSIAWHHLSRKSFLTMLGIVLTLSLFLPKEWLLGRFGLLSPSGLRVERLQFWVIALRAIAHHPLTGYGMGNFEMAYNQFAFPVMDDLVRYGHTTSFAHNEFLQLIAEMGIPAGGFFLLALGSLLLTSVRRDYAWDLPAKTSLIVLAVISAVNPILHMPLLVYTGLLFAFILLKDRTAKKNNSTAFSYSTRIPGKMSFTCIIGLLLFLSSYFSIHSLWAKERQWKRIVALAPYDGEAWHQLASLQKDASQRMDDERRAVENSPDNLYFREALAAELEISSLDANVPLALQQYLQALILCPTRAIDNLAIGRILLREGSPQTALPWFEKARALEPHYWESDLWMARCYRASGRKDKSEFALSSLLTRHAEIRYPNYLWSRMSPYEHVILSFDEQIVKRELK